MASVIKIERETCLIELFDGETKCGRQANFEVAWSRGGRKLTKMRFCYRHRWRAYDLACDEERVRGAAA